MKVKFLKRTAFLLILVASLSSCDKLRRIDLYGIDELINSIIPRPDSIFYVVGYDVNCGVEIQDSTAKAVVYVFVSEDLKDTLAAKLSDSLFIFPAKIMPCCNIFGFNLFPQEYRFVHKVQMTYQFMTREEWEEVMCTGTWNKPMLYSFEPTYVVITSIAKMQ
jgi:hypothetical protein